MNSPISCQCIREAIFVHNMRASLAETAHDLSAQMQSGPALSSRTILTFAPSPFNISTNKLPASSPCSVRTSTNIAHPFKILSEDFLTPPEPFTVPLLGPAPPLPCTSPLPARPTLSEPSSAGLPLQAAVLELRNPVRVPIALGFGGVGVCGKDDRLSESAWSADEARLRVEEGTARCFPLSAEMGEVVKSISMPLLASMATGGGGI